ncbi:MAG: cell division protein FtsA [Roseiflexaceae bacterium]
MPQRNIAAIDIGSTKIITIIAQIDSDNAITVLGYGDVPSKGIERGIVVNIDEAARAVNASINKAEIMAGYRIESAFVSITGRHIRSYVRDGAVAIARPASNSSGYGTVTREDILRAVETAQAEALSPTIEQLHVMPYRYVLDGTEVHDPIGMPGLRLEVDIHVVVCESSAIMNIINIVRQSNIEIDDIVLQPIAAAEGVLTEDERNNGVIVVDIGSGTTGLAFFARGNVWHTAMIPIGGQTITNDISITFQLNPHSAETNKRQIGEAIADPHRHNDLIEVEGVRPGERMNISRLQFNECIQARCDELIEFMIREVDRSVYDGPYAAGVVLTGGGAQLKRIDRLFYERLSAPVRIATVPDIHGHDLKSPAYATALGLIRWGYNHGRIDVRGPEEDSRWVEIYERFKMWLREFLP